MTPTEEAAKLEWLKQLKKGDAVAVGKPGALQMKRRIVKAVDRATITLRDGSTFWIANGEEYGVAPKHGRVIKQTSVLPVRESPDPEVLEVEILERQLYNLMDDYGVWVVRDWPIERVRKLAEVLTEFGISTEEPGPL